MTVSGVDRQHAGSASGTPTQGETWPDFLRHDVRDWFFCAGWTAREWNRLYATAKAGAGAARAGGQQQLWEWLRNPSMERGLAFSSDTVMDAFTRYGRRMPAALAAYAAGASPRFVTAFLDGMPDGSPARPWKLLHTDLGLTEIEATGWALAIALYERNGQEPIDLVPEVTAWSSEFGAGGFEFVLAGFTVGEAVGMRAAGTLPGPEELRVMAALNGAVFPAGI